MTPFYIPDLTDSLHFFGELETQHLPNQLKILIWNVYKGKRGLAWKNDFLSIGRGQDLLLLQEAMLDDIMPPMWKEDWKTHQWKMATSFIYKGSTHRTGVATGSKFISRETKVFRGVDREIFVWTPKVTMSSLYKTESEKSLLVINTHALLITTTRAFIRYIDSILSEITHHTGPLIFAGDFNTWNNMRWRALVQLLKTHGLEHVNLPNDQRFLKLDHIFVRNLEVISAKIRNDIYTSDHSPLEVEIKLK